MPWWISLLFWAMGLWVLDRVLLWVESRGWLYYRKKAPTGGGSSAMLGIAVELFQPAQHSVVQELEQQSRRVDESWDADPLDRRKSKLRA